MDRDQVLEAIVRIDTLPPYEETRQAIEGMSLRDRGGFFLENNVFEVFTREYVDALADTLRELQGRYGSHTPIVEVGAGNGKLSRHLRGRGIDIVATDDYKLEGMIDDISRDGAVEKLTHTQAMARYDPQIVLCSWAPNGSDMERDVLSHPSTRALISIGEGPEGCCGSRSVYEIVSVPCPLPDVTRYSISRTAGSEAILYEKSV